MGYYSSGLAVSAATFCASLVTPCFLAASDTDSTRKRWLVGCCVVTGMASFVSMIYFASIKVFWNPKLSYHTAEGFYGSLSLENTSDVLSGRMISEIPPNVISIAIQNAQINDTVLRQLAVQCKNLRELAIESCTELNGTSLGEFGSLQTLYLSHTPVKSLAHLKKARCLTELGLETTQLQAHKITELLELTQLQKLRIRGLDQPLGLVREYFPKLTSLKELWIEECSTLRCADLDPLRRALPKTTIYFDHYQEITEAYDRGWAMGHASGQNIGVRH